MPYYSLSCVFSAIAFSMCGLLLMMARAPLWFFLILGCAGVIAIMLLGYWELESIDKCYFDSSQSEKEKLLEQKRRKHRRNTFVLLTSIILMFLFLAWGVAHHFTAITRSAILSNVGA